MWMQGKVNVLHDEAIAARVGEGDVAEFEALAEGAGGRDGVGRGRDGGLHRKEIEEVFEEDGLLGNVVEAGEDLLDVGAGAVEGSGEERKAAEGDGAGEGAREDDGVGTVIASGGDDVEGRTEECALHRKLLIF